MRENLLDQLPLVPAPIDHPHAQELSAMSALLDQLPEAVAAVHEDLSWRGKKRVDPSKGRDGMAAEQVLRATVIKQMTSFSYSELAFHLIDSSTYRGFVRLGYDDRPPKKSALQKNIKRVKPETWERINEMIVLKAKELGIEGGDKIRTDCTVVESNIHHPTDNSLLWDCVRVLTRLLSSTEKEFGISFNDHSRRARRRAMKISNAKSFAERKPFYRDLVKVTEKVVAQAERVATELEQVECDGITQVALMGALQSEFRKYAGLANQVISQTQRRVFRGESVPSSEKIVSIFETHTNIIIKGHREVEYGHKLCLTTGASGMITDVVVLEGNPADSTLAFDTIERHKARFGQAPRQVTFDGAFASQANVATIKAAGVEDVAFNKSCGLEITDMVKSKRVYRMLSKFRSGIEGTISFLKRVVGLERCPWRGWTSFKAYVQASVTTCNLLLLARRVLAAKT